MSIYSRIVNEKAYSIVGGPSRDTVVDAFKYAYDEGVDIPLAFRVITGVMLCSGKGEAANELFSFKEIRLQELGHESGSGYSLHLIGYCVIEAPGAIDVHARFESWYDAKHRKGWMKFSDIKER